jgi:hypothetical protein
LLYQFGRQFVTVFCGQNETAVVYVYWHKQAKMSTAGIQRKVGADRVEMNLYTYSGYYGRTDINRNRQRGAAVWKQLSDEHILYQFVQSTFVVFACFSFWSAAAVNRTSFHCMYQFSHLTYGLYVFARPVVAQYIDHVFPSGIHQTSCFGIKARYNVCLAGNSG